jgi:hypothetical protein
MEVAGVVVAGALLTRLLRETITPKSNSAATSMAPTPIMIHGIEELVDAVCVDR